MSEHENKYFTISVNGKLDRVFEARKMANRCIFSLGRVAYTGIEVMVNVLDELVTEYNKL